MKAIWIDIDNPPQVQYLLPFRRYFLDYGFQVILTARDNGITKDLLDNFNLEYYLIGRSFGKSRLKKIMGVVARSSFLLLRVTRSRPVLSLSSSRSSSLAAFLLRIPSFIFCDYEYADLTLYRIFNSIIIHPDIIPQTFFISRGFKKDNLIPYKGLKEDFTFDSMSTSEFQSCDFEREFNDYCKVLLRPPAEQSHYYVSRSGEMTYKLLENLSLKSNVKLIYSPRYDWQIKMLERFKWMNDPIIIGGGIHFIKLLNSIDLVISSGGTMLREAAYLDIPAYSLFQSEIGAVDRYLESNGKLVFIRNTDDFHKISFNVRDKKSSKYFDNSNKIKDLISQILSKCE